MTLYVVMYHDYEGSYICGIYSSEFAARQRVESILNTSLTKQCKLDYTIDLWNVNSDFEYNSLRV